MWIITTAAAIVVVVIGRIVGIAITTTTATFRFYITLQPVDRFTKILFLVGLFCIS